MWKRDDAAAAQPQQGGQTPGRQTNDPQAARSDRQEASNVNIGKSVIIKGELSGSEDLTIEGQVDGKIELRQNVLTIGPNGRIKAQINAKAVVVQGEVIGNITATEKVDIRDAGSVDGDLSAPRIAIADGAHFRGSIEMKPAAAATGAGAAKPAQGSQPGQASTAGSAGMPGAQTSPARPVDQKPGENKPGAPVGTSGEPPKPAGQR